MKFFLGLLITTTTLFAQYTKDDSLLVRTTFLREFDSSIINQYLYSDNTQKVKASLLSISNSKDTSYFPRLTKLEFDNFPVETWRR